MALSSDRNLDYRGDFIPPQFGYFVQAGWRVFRGSIVALCADLTIVPAGVANAGAAQVTVAGIASELRDNTGGGTLPSVLSSPTRVLCRRGCVLLPFDTAPGGISVHAPVYAIDDQTVSLTSTATSGGTTINRLQVGTLVGFDESNNPWVLV